MAGPTIAPPTPPTLPATSATQGEPILKDIHFAASPSFWPPALGWWILLALLMMLLAGFFLWLNPKLKKRKRHQLQREKLLSKLAVLEAQLAENPSNKVIAEINTLLRQCAVNYYPRSKISSLTGSDWLNFLDQSGNTTGFSKGAGRILIEAPYQAGVTKNLNRDEFLTLIRKWISQLSNKENTGGNTA